MAKIMVRHGTDAVLIWNLWAASILAQIIWISVFAPRWFISKTKTLKLRLISHINPMGISSMPLKARCQRTLYASALTCLFGLGLTPLRPLAWDTLLSVCTFMALK